MYRQWGNRVKGRDWFDFEWYVRQGIPLNLIHFAERAFQGGDLASRTLESESFLDMLQARIQGLNISSAKEDVERFLRDSESLKIWSTSYFLELSKLVKFS
jgi:hypothetical protein